MSLRSNHQNSGGGGTDGLGAQHQLTRLPDAPLAGTGKRPSAPEGTLGNHLNTGGHTGVMDDSLGRGRSPMRQTPDATELETDVMD
jgi:hypothetical protein